ncbi:MAG: hypothetical protein WCH43_03155 [Verrucomicrobiota bacterium]
MKIKSIRSGIVTLLFALNATGMQAADTYEKTLQTGDEHQFAKMYTEALADYDTALGQAENDTERGLALSKKAYIYAYTLKNYPAAKEAAENALKLENTRPVARVTALQALAECQMKATPKDYSAAAKNLETAMKLEGVDWALPGLALSLGDCDRFAGQFDEALIAYKRVLDSTAAKPDLKGIAYLNMGLTYQYDLSNFDQAKESYKKAVELNPALKKEIDEHLARIH